MVSISKENMYYLLLLFMLSFAKAQQQYDADAWKSAATYLKQAMNKKSKPCENFYDHICGAYGADNETSYETTLAGKASAVSQILIKAIKGVDAENAKTPDYQKAVKRFYDQCTSTEFDPYWPQRLYESIAKRIGGLPLFEKLKTNNEAIENSVANTTSFNHWRLAGQLQRRLGESMLIYGWMSKTGTGCQKKTELKLYPIPPSRHAGAINATEIRLRMFRLAQGLGLNLTELEPLIEPWFEKINALYDDLRNMTVEPSVPRRMSLGNLSSVLPDFDWQEYVSGLLPEKARRALEMDIDNQVVYVSDVRKLEKVAQILKRHGEEAIRSLAFMRVYFSTEGEYFGTSDQEHRELMVEFKSAEERCLKYALRHLSPAVARLYFDAIGVDIMKWRHEIQMLGRNIFSAFRFLLNSVDWLDSEDKEKIQEKIDKIIFKPGIPAWIGNVTKVMQRITIYNTSLGAFDNEFSAKEIKFDRYMKQASEDEKVDDDDSDPDPSFIVNAQYDSSNKQIDMFLGLMVPPLFNITYPLPVKYGGLGVVIGHELMHAFDDDGIYAGAYKGHQWLKPEAFREFGKKKACLVRQYSKYCYKDKGMCVRGDVTIGENIADIDGMKVAYTAYRIVTQVLGQDPPIPDMIDYTDDQIFFLSFARTWCSKETGSWLNMQLNYDVHTPNKARVDVAVRNLPLFARAFQCTVGSKYAPMHQCSMWGDLEEPAKK